jgi:predicted DNA-binding protein
MSVTISLPPEEEKKLADRAAATGQDVAKYVRQLIKKDIDLPSFAELFSSVHQAVRESGIGSADLDSLLETAITDSRANRRS